LYGIKPTFTAQVEEIKPYQNKESSKKTQVTNMFNNIAPYYDVLNHVLSLGIDIIWRKKAIKLLKKSNPKTILDIATGTADLAIEASRQIPDAKIIGLDISPKMIEIGKKKITKKNLLDQISLEVGDSEKLRFESKSFDATTAAFGVRNFENLEDGLNEMFRILNPGGQIVVLEFSKPTIFPFKQLFNLYFKYILPLIGKIKSKDPKAYKYLYESVQQFPDYAKFGEVLERVGFKEIKYKPLSLGICTIYLGTK